jgi:uncharacterized DUF497 family protein
MSDDPDEIRFEWDPEKARANARKHGVTFEEAASVFYDDLARIGDDPDHSVGEYRELIVGKSVQGRLLLVIFTERGEAIRIIHARETAASERRNYEKNLLRK